MGRGSILACGLISALFALDNFLWMYKWSAVESLSLRNGVGTRGCQIGEPIHARGNMCHVRPCEPHSDSSEFSEQSYDYEIIKYPNSNHQSANSLKE
jgi:hypothetical protein